jgi:hypothetical protein
MSDLEVKNKDLSNFLYYDLYLEIFPPLDNQDIIWELRNIQPDRFSVQIGQYILETKVQYDIL